MIEALLLAVRDTIIDPDNGFDYGKQSCEIRDDGHPPPLCRKSYLAVHQMPERSVGINRLDEYFSYALTLTVRVTAPFDRIGDAELAQLLARKTGFNRRMRALKVFLHGNWGVISIANDYLVKLAEDAEIVYGFCEAGMASTTEKPELVGPDWFGAMPPESAAEAEKNMGIKAQVTFVDIRRIQAIGTYT